MEYNIFNKFEKICQVKYISPKLPAFMHCSVQSFIHLFFLSMKHDCLLFTLIPPQISQEQSVFLTTLYVYEVLVKIYSLSTNAGQTLPSTSFQSSSSTKHMQSDLSTYLSTFLLLLLTPRPFLLIFPSLD